MSCSGKNTYCDIVTVGRKPCISMFCHLKQNSLINAIGHTLHPSVGFYRYLNSNKVIWSDFALEKKLNKMFSN